MGAGPLAGWYPDPNDSRFERYWNGVQWTEQVRVPASPGSPAHQTARQPEAPAESPADRAAGWVREHRVWAEVVGAIVVLVVGVAIGSAGGGASDEDAEVAGAAVESTTTAVSTTRPAPPTTRRPTTTTVPTTTRPTTTTTTAPPYVTPTPQDFRIEIIETERSCFGSAGCNITYRINPTYTGGPIRPGARYTVVYEVRGGEDLQTKNFTLEGGEARFEEDRISTPPGPTLTAVPIRVLEG